MARRVTAFLAGFLVICGGLVLLPAIDLAASRLFYTPADRFFASGWLPFRIAHALPPYLMTAAIIAAVAILVAAWRGRPIRGLDHRAGLFLLVALAVGPGLIVNTLFKDHWGRARPAQIVAFGGDKRFTPAFVPSDQCGTNCSFPSGDPAVGYYFVAAGFLAAPQRRRRLVAGALTLGAVIGVARIAQGAHFLSDVIASGFIIFATTWLLHRWIVVADGLATLRRQLVPPTPAFRRFALATALTAAATLASIAWVDRPLAAYCHTIGPGLHAAFGVVTTFGVSTFYLIAAALLAVGLALMARPTDEPARRRRLNHHALRAAFVFVTVAGAGLVGDIIKPVFGRARPTLWLHEGIFGFTWHGAHAVYWSFPSGHTITIAALAASLARVERRGLPLYVAAALLVAASRVVLDEHYLSDVLAGIYIAWLTCWAARASFERAGIALALSDTPRTPRDSARYNGAIPRRRSE
ncbi:MAG TPA: phosphatase PAP2 family protein [Stellaceae bacterium]|nr:phosphatase PAP2 family protein [Stellaceae bacterium]